MIELPQLALSIRQPWVWAILNLGKDIENRDWPTKVRGRVCLHAAQACGLQEWRDGVDAINYACGDFMEVPKRELLMRGGIVGTVQIVDCVRESKSAWFFGSFGFVLRDPQPCDFVPVKGQLGFFDWRKRLEEG